MVKSLNFYFSFLLRKAADNVLLYCTQSTEGTRVLCNTVIFLFIGIENLMQVIKDILQYNQ